MFKRKEYSIFFREFLNDETLCFQVKLKAKNIKSILKTINNFKNGDAFRFFKVLKKKFKIISYDVGHSNVCFASDDFFFGGIDYILDENNKKTKIGKEID